MFLVNDGVLNNKFDILMFDPDPYCTVNTSSMLKEADTDTDCIFCRYK